MRTIHCLGLILSAAILFVCGCGGGNSPVSVVQAPSALTYSTMTAAYIQGTAVAPNNPSNGGGAATSYTVNPALPAGLNLSTSTGVISGTPTAVAATASYTVTASNSSGSTTASLSITVNVRGPGGPCLQLPARRSTPWGRRSRRIAPPARAER